MKNKGRGMKKFYIYSILFIYFMVLILFMKEIGFLEASFMGILMCIIYSIIFLVYTVFFTIVSRTAKRHVKKEKLSKEDIIKNKDMYRDIIKNVSPALLLYIDNMEISYEKAIIGTLLYLQKEGYIAFEDKKIVKLKDMQYLTKGTIEYLVMENIGEKHGKVKVISDNETKRAIVSEGLKKKYLEANYNKCQPNIKNTIIRILVFNIISIIVYLLTTRIRILTWILFSFIVSLPTISIVYFIVYYINIKGNPIYRSDEGEEINKKLEGLKGYLKDYSMLKDRDADMVKIWDDYLIYSVLFGHNRKIIRKYRKYIKS